MFFYYLKAPLQTSDSTRVLTGSTQIGNASLEIRPDKAATLQIAPHLRKSVVLSCTGHSRSLWDKLFASFTSFFKFNTKNLTLKILLISFMQYNQLHLPARNSLAVFATSCTYVTTCPLVLTQVSQIRTKIMENSKTYSISPKLYSNYYHYFQES